VCGADLIVGWLSRITFSNQTKGRSEIEIEILQGLSHRVGSGLLAVLPCCFPFLKFWVDSIIEEGSQGRIKDQFFDFFEQAVEGLVSGF